MAEFDVDAMITRFKQRAEAVRERGIPPPVGSARRQFIEAAGQDYTDYMLIALAQWSVADGRLTLEIPLSKEAQG